MQLKLKVEVLHYECTALAPLKSIWQSHTHTEKTNNQSTHVTFALLGDGKQTAH